MSVMMKGLTLKQTEQTRLATLNLVLGKQITVAEASHILNISERHTWRILNNYKKEGAQAIAHGNRGRTPWNATPKEVTEQITRLAKTNYVGLNHTHQLRSLCHPG